MLFFSFADESYFSIIYGYGKLNGVDYPHIYSLSLENKKSYYVLSSFDNNKEQNLHKFLPIYQWKRRNIRY